ncbi:MAG: hypothetical protein AMXMBFR25_11910 [Lysobacterales bacterium]
MRPRKPAAATLHAPGASESRATYGALLRCEPPFTPPTIAPTYACNVAASIPANSAQCIYHPSFPAGSGGVGSADLSIVLANTLDPAIAGTNLTYTPTPTNLGPSDAQNARSGFPPPTGTNFVLATPMGVFCSGTTTVTCTWAGATAPGVTRTLTVVAFSNVEGNTTVNASTTSSTIDPNPDNNAAAIAVVVGYPFNEIPTLGQWGLLLLGLLPTDLGFTTLRRQG